MGVSVSKSMSGLWSSNMVTMSVREGLLCPAYCVLSVSMVISVVGGSVSAGGVVVSASVEVRDGGWPSGDGVLLQ